MRTVKRALVLKFETENQKEVELSILKPAEGLDPLDVKDAMNAIIDSGAFGEEGAATKILGAEYDVRQIEEIVLG